MMFPAIDKKRTGERIRWFMEKRGMNPVDIQTYLGLSCVQTVYRWLDGTNIPSVDNLYALSSLLHVDMDDLVAGTADYGRPARSVYDWHKCLIPDGFHRRVLYYYAVLCAYEGAA